ncbi:MAG: rhodanese-like domain-containing protein [Candidatus Pacearchaeota archaeon]|jgi:rhodanese-related sulfurtransferase
MAVKNINANELRNLIKNHRDKIEIIDVREPSEHEIIRIKNSKLIPMNELQNHLNEIDWEKQVIFICRSGSRSRMIANLVSQMGRDVSNLQYGIYECFKDSKGENLEVNEEMTDKYF